MSFPPPSFAPEQRIGRPPSKTYAYHTIRHDALYPAAYPLMSTLCGVFVCARPLSRSFTPPASFGSGTAIPHTQKHRASARFCFDSTHPILARARTGLTDRIETERHLVGSRKEEAGLPACLSIGPPAL